MLFFNGSLMRLNPSSQVPVICEIHNEDTYIELRLLRDIVRCICYSGNTCTHEGPFGAINLAHLIFGFCTLIER
jgi:hypothetical protein